MVVSLDVVFAEHSSKEAGVQPSVTEDDLTVLYDYPSETIQPNPNDGSSQDDQHTENTPLQTN